jgi:hypothetical protein
MRRVYTEGFRDPIFSQLQIADLYLGRHQACFRLGDAAPGEGELPAPHQINEGVMRFRMRRPEVLDKEHLF